MKNAWIIVATLAAAGAPVVAQTGHQDTTQDKTRTKQRQQDQSTQQGQRDQRDTNRTGDAMGRPMFISCDQVRGMDVKNSAGDTVGTIRDLILDRGSGEVAFAVMKSGTILGLGGRETVVPVQSLRWDAENKNALLEVTTDQIRTWPEFDLDRWSRSDRSEQHLPRQLASQYYQGSWPQVTMAEGRETERIRGKVTRIDRQSTNGTPEEIVITVGDNNASQHQIVLGPSWYLSGNNVLLQRGANVDIEVVRVMRGGEQMMYASNITTDNNQRIPLYGESGWPSWSDRSNTMGKNTDATTPSGTRSTTGNNDTRDNDNRNNQPRTTDATNTMTNDFIDTPFILSSEIDDKDVVARGEKCGEIDDVILDANAKRIAFLIVDPSPVDNRHLVPWGVVSTVGKDMVMLDASKDMITMSAKAPTDLSTLYASDAYKSIYRTYDVAEPGMHRSPR